MFIEFLYQIYAGCSNPMEYVMVSLLFIFIFEFFARIIGSLLSFRRI